MSHLAEGKCWSSSSTASLLSATRHTATHTTEAWHATETTGKALCSSSSSGLSTTATPTSVHKAAKSAVVFHVLCEEHLKNLVRIERHASLSSAWHPSHVKVHATWEACATHSSRAISHIIHAHSHIVLLTLLWI